MRLILVIIILPLLCASAHAEYVYCDLSVDTSVYHCRGWRDGAGPNGSRARVIAQMFGEEYEDDFGRRLTGMGDINSDGHADFMVWVPGKCEWRVYHGDTLITKQPAYVWPKCNPGFPGLFNLIDDITGDDQPDLLRFLNNQRVELYHAGTAFDTIPDLVFWRPEFTGLGIFKSVAAGLDINGDGEPDLALGDEPYRDPEYPKQYGRIYLYWGGTALDTTPDLIFSDTFFVGQSQLQAVGTPIALLPSLNADAYADLVVGRRSKNRDENIPPARVDVYFGGPSMDTTADLSFICPDTAYDPDYGYIIAAEFAGDLINVGDANQDGYDDLLVSGGQIVPAYLYHGGPDFDGIHDLVLSGGGFGERGDNEGLVTLGDVNGDGIRDFATIFKGDPNLVYDGHVHIRFPRAGFDGSSDWEIYGDDWYYASEAFGRETQSLGDVDGDGIADFAVGSKTDNVEVFNLGMVFIFAGCVCDVNTGVFDDPGTDESYSRDGELMSLSSQNPSSAEVILQLNPNHLSLSVVVYDILGRRVKNLHAGESPPSGQLIWDLRDAGNRRVASGVYFVRAQSAVASTTVKVMVLK